MQQMNFKDVGYGLALVLAGGAIAIYAISNYRLGSTAEMGPGLFPAGVGALVGILGAIIALSGFRKPQAEEETPKLDVRSTLSVLAAISTFALTVTTLGLFPAITLMVAVASLADDKLKPHVAALLAAALCLFAYIVFHVGLGMPWALYRWPF